MSPTATIKSRTPSIDYPSVSFSLAETLPTQSNPVDSWTPSSFSPYTPTITLDAKPLPTYTPSITMSDSLSQKESVSHVEGSMSASDTAPPTFSESLSDSPTKDTPSSSETRHKTLLKEGLSYDPTGTPTISNKRTLSITPSLRNVSFVPYSGTELLVDLDMKSPKGHTIRIEMECCSIVWVRGEAPESSLFLTSVGSVYTWDPALDVRKFSVTSVVAGDDSDRNRRTLRPEDEGHYQGRLVINMRPAMFVPQPTWPLFSLDFEVVHKDPPSDQLSDAQWYLQGTANVLVSISSMSSIFTLSVGGAVQAGRFQGMFIGTFCNLNEVHLSSIMHPTQIQIGSEKGSVPEYLGAFIVNMVVVISFSIGHCLLVHIWYQRKKQLRQNAHDRRARGESVPDATLLRNPILFSAVAGLFRFPSLSMWLTFYFMQVILTGAIYVTTHSNDTLIQTIAVINVCFFLSSTLLFTHITVGRGHLAKWRVHECLPAKPLDLFLFCCFNDQGEWINDAMKNNRFIERYGSLFYHFTPKHQWFVIIETLMMFTIASVSAVIPSNRNHCKITSGGMIVVFGAYTLALVILRPYNNFRTQVLQTTVAGAQTFACCVGLLAVIYPKERYALTNAAQVVGLLAAMVNLSEAVLALTVIFFEKETVPRGGW